ncbi:MAG: peptide ABC transporter ATPase [Candidatus Bathyarchaeota archaeon B26-2]|nr:MAG: peptide ABC transporter ATPase [Candidatus Bathyarchaeota archaeon B26-2]
MSEGEMILTVEDLRKFFELRKGLFSKPVYVKAVDGVTFTLKKGESISLVGESGSGKTTLGKTILRLYEPTKGKIIFKDKDVTHLSSESLMWYRRETSLIQQDPYGALPSFLPIRRIIEEPLIIHKIGDKSERLKRVYDALSAVRLTPVEDFASKYPHMLSGGQLQRVAIARALVLEPELVIADEPVSMLDASVRIETLTLLRNLQETRKISFIYITHDLATTKYFSERLFIMYAGKILESGNIRDVIMKPLHPYTQALIKAIPDPDPENRKVLRDVPPGEPPNLIHPPSGCRFHPRCPYVMDICRVEEPPIVEREKEGFVACWLHAKH